MNELLNDNATYVKLNKDPTIDVNTSFNKELKKILKGSPELIKQFLTINPSLPYMYGLVKTHKPNLPMRPIVSSVGSAAYKLAKWLVNLLSPLVGKISNSHLLNNVDLVSKLLDFDYNNNFKLISFDVTSLFTKVPVNDLLLYLEDELKFHSFCLDHKVIIDLIKLCICNCKFQFEDQFYMQKFGMAMGNPLSPVLANIYMEFFERNFVYDLLPRNTPWFRYVDDILCLWPFENNELDFLDNINNLVPSIKFTIESENNKCLPFLDVLIHRSLNNFEFEIYRKPTNICSYVHFFSNHHPNTKKSVFTSMFLRALRIVSPKYFDLEIETINDIGKSLKYPEEFLNTCLKSAKKSFYNDKILRPKMDNILCLPFYKEFMHIPHALRKFNINVVFQNKNKLKTLLIKNSPDTQLGCIYRIPCLDCDRFYIGQTGKSIKVRITQHKYSVRSGQLSNALFLHFSENNHRIDWKNTYVIKNNNSIIERNIIESCLIKHTFDKNLNISLGLYNLDSFIINRLIMHIG